MKRSRIARGSCIVLALAFGHATPLALSGCGGAGGETGLVTAPKTSPIETAKASMDAMKAQIAGAKHKPGRR